MNAYLGIDCSTTATKVLLMTGEGEVAGTASSTYHYETPHPLWSEQHPQLWWDASVTAIRRVLAQSGVRPSDIRAIGLTGQMHGLVLLDENGEILRRAILWNDQRSAAECDQMRKLIGKQRLIDITGNDALAGFTASKLLWVREHEPLVYAQIAHILLPKDYVRFKLTGTYATDKADGAGTQFFDLRQRDWSADILQTLHVDRDWLPPALEGTDVSGVVSASAASATGLKPGIPVVAGGGDQAVSAVGTGAVRDGIVALSLGTSGVVFASTDRPVVEPEGRLHAFCHAVPGKWHMMGVMLSAAGSLRWYRDLLATNAEYYDLLEAAASVPAASEGLLFLPYLTGERTPHADPLARGAFIGLTVRHTMGHLTRSILEGVAFGLRDGFELMNGAGLAAVRQVRASGGGSRSRLWRQIVADVLQTDIATINTTEGAAYGAAMLAAVGVGTFSSVESACRELIQITGYLSPGKDAVVYDELYPLYRHMYPALRSTFAHLARLEQS